MVLLELLSGPARRHAPFTLLRQQANQRPEPLKRVESSGLYV
jgi:hypothetical protein